MDRNRTGLHSLAMARRWSLGNFDRSFDRRIATAGRAQDHQAQHTQDVWLSAGSPRRASARGDADPSAQPGRDHDGDLYRSTFGGYPRGAQEARTVARGHRDMSVVAPAYCCTGGHKGPVTRSQSASELGALGGTRTPNLLIRSQMLYPLSYERSPCSISRPSRWLRLVPTARARAQPGPA